VPRFVLFVGRVGGWGCHQPWRAEAGGAGFRAAENRRAGAPFCVCARLGAPHPTDVEQAKAKRAARRPYSTTAIIINGLLSAAPRFGILRNLYRLLVPPSAHTIYHHRTRAGVRITGSRAPTCSHVSLPTTPSERIRNSAHCSPNICEKPNCLLDKMCRMGAIQLQGLSDRIVVLDLRRPKVQFLGQISKNCPVYRLPIYGRLFYCLFFAIWIKPEKPQAKASSEVLANLMSSPRAD
jgi:hypothetical protein